MVKLIVNIFAFIIDFIGCKIVWKYNRNNKKIADKRYNEILKIDGDKCLAKKISKLEAERAIQARRIVFWQKIRNLFD